MPEVRLEGLTLPVANGKRSTEILFSAGLPGPRNRIERTAIAPPLGRAR